MHVALINFKPYNYFYVKNFYTLKQRDLFEVLPFARASYSYLIFCVDLSNKGQQSQTENQRHS